ncbi:MAG TPA: GNAT family N-acetyltransferase [Solirubrobacteraceae bacterium]
MKAERATIEDLQRIIASLPEFWGDRDTAALHQALFVHELGDTSLVIRDADGTVLAYLLGFVSPASVGYIHVVAVRRSHRGRGLARSLYESFETIARQRGAVELKAITSPGNRGSHAFHDALGFSTSEVGGYSASGEARSVFRLALR